MSTGPHDLEDTYEGYSVDESDQLPTEDTLDDDDVVDALDRGYSPPEKYSTAQDHGTTPYEEATGETLDQRIAQEVPEADPYDVTTEVSETETLDDGEVGDERAGRLVAPDEGLTEDTEKDLVGEDVGIDGAAASAEEAAVHVVSEG
ncbi:DUF5709 domain-containing protein [Nocardioides sp. GY 10127]|uniref:DUF5709 domain-containing protein n=1 Tax=Nocardioides sp. GY 10127 TaxID=2569762 RepID=UPI0010A8E575|nr:DUF5709 domain-containing protein [Nocardioides sp. GY 10127]TIC84335.1 hypothetical protein E8D37_06065 [Nocardioides sp. GY 10127]